MEQKQISKINYNMFKHESVKDTAEEEETLKDTAEDEESRRRILLKYKIMFFILYFLHTIIQL